MPYELVFYEILDMPSNDSSFEMGLWKNSSNILLPSVNARLLVSTVIVNITFEGHNRNGKTEIGIGEFKHR